MADVLRKLGIQSSLTFIKHNLPESFSPPDLERTLADYPHGDALRREITEMLAGDSIKKLYAAILLWSVDRPRAEKVLEESANDMTTTLLLPRAGGMGWIESSVKGAALDFLAGESVMGVNWSQAEKLSNLADSVSKQAENEGRTFAKESLPKWIDVLKARENSEKERALLSEIEKLENGAAIEKIYAGMLLKSLNKPEYKEIFESLLEDKTVVIYGSGDLRVPTPVKTIAESFLNLKPPAAPSKGIVVKTFDC